MAIVSHQLMKLRLTVARFGEMDRAKWWNTNGMLSDIGKLAISRGFPRTHLLAQARTVFAVALHRCDEVYNAPGAVTLWKLPAEIEDQFDDAWSIWLDDLDPWDEFLQQLNAQTSDNLLDVLLALDLIDEEIVQQIGRLKRAADSRSVPLSDDLTLDDRLIMLLAASFARGESGKLAVPYVQLKEALV